MDESSIEDAAVACECAASTSDSASLGRRLMFAARFLRSLSSSSAEDAAGVAEAVSKLFLGPNGIASERDLASAGALISAAVAEAVREERTRCEEQMRTNDEVGDLIAEAVRVEREAIDIAASYACPICGGTSPHAHSPELIDLYEGEQSLVRELRGLAEAMADEMLLGCDESKRVVDAATTSLLTEVAQWSRRIRARAASGEKEGSR